MNAIVCTKYGSPEVLQFREVEKPIPKNNEVLVKIYATTVTIGDVIIRSGKHPDSKFYSLMLHKVFGLRKPKNPILGMEVAGEIVAIGNGVTLFKEGDALVLKPENISYEEAAPIAWMFKFFMK